MSGWLVRQPVAKTVAEEGSVAPVERVMVEVEKDVMAPRWTWIRVPDAIMSMKILSWTTEMPQLPQNKLYLVNISAT